jgi:SAM-dependent methyltransferase
MMEALEKHLSHQLERYGSFFWHRLRWHAVSRFFPTDRSFRLLDVGAGAGLLGHYLRQSFPQGSYFFIEPIGSLERHLERVFGPERNLKDHRDLAEIDLVVLLDVLEHQEDDVAFLRDLVARLRPSCTVIFTVPALSSLWSEWDVLLGHRRRYSRASLSAAVSASGLRLVTQRYLFPELLPLAYYRKWRRGGRNRHGEVRTEFPDLPDALNAMLYGFGRLSLIVSPVAPVGTSLLAVGRTQ